MITLLLITNRFADGTQICLVTYMFLLCQHLDSNCIQVLAPENMEGLNSGRTKLENTLDTSARKVHANWLPFLINLLTQTWWIQYLLTAICVIIVRHILEMATTCVSLYQL